MSFYFFDTTFNCDQIDKTVGGLNYTYKKILVRKCSGKFKDLKSS